MNGLGKPRHSCRSEPGVYCDDVEPRVGHLDAVGMGQAIYSGFKLGGELRAGTSK